MLTVNVATLKEKLSHFLKLVEGGQEVVITAYRQKVARILPMTASTAEPDPAVRPVADLLKVKGIRRRQNISGVEALMEDRRTR
jgi:antitoxin (DNA-binding transcriptional repressor) of toxin-antitoxin stability system